MVLQAGNLILRKATDADLHYLWELIYSDLEWKKFDGPYYPFVMASLEEFRNGFFNRLKNGDRALLIELDGEVLEIGRASCRERV